MSVLLVYTSSIAAENYVNSINMEFVHVPAGTFLMGTPDLQQGSSKEKPQHSIHISKSFYLGKYEVIQKQWMAVMGNINPSNFLSPDRPVDEVSWNDVQLFIRKLNAIEKSNSYRLPTEAEWEYAARAGSETSVYYGNDPEGKELEKYAWFEENAEKQTHPVGMLAPNAWGLYDMYGNVSEWTQDRYDKQYYLNSPVQDPHGPETGHKRVVRGGSWINQAYSCRSAARGYFSPDYTDSDFGFRIVKSMD
ncbi:MAG TPA: formylglycine-generating enzyme family protein [Desulfobacterales bacterium]|nr:formylglycine-generating enzyme family protein [Desulfobacterales bacterium]